MSFDLLSQPIRKYVREKRWESLRPIQAAAIEKILSTEYNYILASRTASGKTEAAFLPILSRVNFNEPGVQVLYISPLIALINDQVNRVEDLCKYLDVTVTKWHGEANKSLKEKLLKDPSGIVLITPESLEAMFVNKPYNVKHLYSNLKYIIIDEIHSFIGTDRGTQLKSILSRLQSFNIPRFKIVGLSATIGDYQQAKNFTGDAANTKVLLDRTAKEINVAFRYYDGGADELPRKLIEDLYEETKENKVLIFPNSRGKAEEIAVGLKKISEKRKGHQNYFSHHSSVDRDVREYVEYFAKNNARRNFAIACTSTLELGIDIGAVDEVVQIDATHSIASLIQRVGRSGRKEGQASNLFLYATNSWTLLQSLACWDLYKEGFIEPPDINDKPYDILLHQALSITKGHSGISLQELTSQLKTNAAFCQIEQVEIDEILNHLVEEDLFEKIQNEVIIGLAGEWIVNDKEFYSVFITEEYYKVVNAGNRIGEIPFSPQTVVDENILLAARIWRIKDVDHKSKRIEVVAAPDGKKPFYNGGGANIHPAIKQKMLDLLYVETTYDFLTEEAQAKIHELRVKFSVFPLENTKAERPLQLTEKGVEIFTFTGSKIKNTLSTLFNLAEMKFVSAPHSFEIVGNIDDFTKVFSTPESTVALLDQYLENQLLELPSMINFSKWGKHLPVKYQVQILKAKILDVPATLQYLQTITFIHSQETL